MGRVGRERVAVGAEWSHSQLLRRDSPPPTSGVADGPRLGLTLYTNSSCPLPRPCGPSPRVQASVPLLGAGAGKVKEASQAGSGARAKAELRPASCQASASTCILSNTVSTGPGPRW